MRSLFWVLALFALAVGVSLAMRVNEGYVLLVLPPYRTELSLNLAILLILGAFAALYAFLRAASLTLSLPQRVRAFRARRESERSAAAFGDAVRLFIDGSFREAIGRAEEVRGEGRWPALAALLAARAARQLGSEDEERQWLERAGERAPETTPPVAGSPRPPEGAD